jgi:outer membrane protein TolC
MTKLHTNKNISATAAVVVAAVTGLFAFGPAAGQSSTFQLTPPTLLQPYDPFKGSVTTMPVTAEPIELTLDDAIQRGLNHNLGLLEQKQTARQFQAQVLSVENVFMPDITMEAKTGFQQISLIAQGFKPSLIAQFAPGVTINPIVKVDTTSAKAVMNETLFSMQYIELFRASRYALKAEDLTILTDHGTVIYNVANDYLLLVADVATVQNAKAQTDVSKRLLQQANDQDEAGTATHLDVLRARAQQENDDEALVQAENSLAKDRIALNRVIGLAPSQKVDLVDESPNVDFSNQSLDDVRQLAYANRKDYLAAIAAVRGYELQSRAVRYERAPVLTFKGNYGVTGVTRGFYHSTMDAEGRLEFPLFKEAQLRGDRDVADAQRDQARSQLSSLKADVDAQLRASLLDVSAAAQLVKVAESNHDLAQQTLEQSEERYHAGVDDNLPLIQAQATVAAANSKLVSSLYQYNLAKLALARNTGVLETRYKQYLHGK